jgi:hypothetical protein
MRLHPALGALGLLSALLVPGRACAEPGDPSPTGKGITGGALLGAELVTGVEAAAGVDSTWAYVGGGLAGAAGGGVGGYFLEQDADPHVPLLMLAGGMALIIPATVLVLNATAYRPPADYVQDTAPSDEPVADPPKPSARVPARKSRATHPVPIPPALIAIQPERLALSIPAPEVRYVYTRQEIAALGVRQATEIRIPLLDVRF